MKRNAGYFVAIAAGAAMLLVLAGCATGRDIPVVDTGKVISVTTTIPTQPAPAAAATTTTTVPKQVAATTITVPVPVTTTTVPAAQTPPTPVAAPETTTTTVPQAALPPAGATPAPEGTTTTPPATEPATAPQPATGEAPPSPGPGPAEPSAASPATPAPAPAAPARPDVPPMDLAELRARFFAMDGLMAQVYNYSLGELFPDAFARARVLYTEVSARYGQVVTAPRYDGIEGTLLARRIAAAAETMDGLLAEGLPERARVEKARMAAAKEEAATRPPYDPAGRRLSDAEASEKKADALMSMGSYAPAIDGYMLAGLLYDADVPESGIQALRERITGEGYR